MRARSRPAVSVAGLVFFEVFLPAGGAAPPGEERFVEAIPIRLGGAINTASVLRALGHAVTLAHPAGEGATDAAIAHVAERLGLDALRWPARDDPAITLVTSLAGGERSFVSACDLESLARCPELPRTAWLHVPGLSEAEAFAPRIAAARAAGAIASVSAGWTPEALDRLCASSAPAWDLLLLNAAEAARATGSTDPRRAAACLAGVAAHEVIVTAGADGAYAVLGGAELHAAAIPTAVVDTTGAGDAFAAGFISARLRGLEAEGALAFAARVASRQLGVLGGVADPARYEDLA